MRIFLIACVLVFGLVSTNISAQAIVNPADFNLVLGEWEGTLAYIDYSSGEPYTMPANVKISQSKKKNKWNLVISYPNESSANEKDNLKLSKNGKRLNKMNVVARERIESEVLQIITEKTGKDNKKKATIRNIYILGKNQMILRKEVKFEDSLEWLVRSEYNYTR